MSLAAFAPAQQPVAAVSAPSIQKAPPRRTLSPLFDQIITPQIR